MMCGALITCCIRLEALMHDVWSLDDKVHQAGGIDA